MSEEKDIEMEARDQDDEKASHVLMRKIDEKCGKQLTDDECSCREGQAAFRGCAINVRLLDDPQDISPGQP